jgi:hypothetical protein
VLSFLGKLSSHNNFVTYNTCYYSTETILKISDYRLKVCQYRVGVLRVDIHS